MFDGVQLTLEQHSSNEEQVCESKEGEELNSVFCKPSIAHSGISPATFNHPEGMFPQGPNPGVMAIPQSVFL